MALILREVYLEPGEDTTALPTRVGQLLNRPAGTIRDLRIVRSGVDARRRGRPRRVFNVVFSVSDEDVLLAEQAGNQRLAVFRDVRAPVPDRPANPGRVTVVGMGPAGLFATLWLAQNGVPVTLVEMGEPVEKRVLRVRDYWQQGQFSPQSNIQFGEGGAGTFSDGKLTTRVNDPWNRWILKTFVACGAPESILVEAKPHLGTDVLRRVLIRFRHTLQQLGVQVRFETCLTGLQVADGVVRGGIFNDRDELAGDALILAPGHSARDTYEMLAAGGVAMEAKPFAVGLRVEHPAELINRIQYGNRPHPDLPPAEYILRYNDAESSRGVYSFCMCPGGVIVSAPSEAGGMVVNGMSDYKRKGDFSNSALVVTVDAADFPGEDPLAGVRFQRHWENEAFVAGGGDYRAPAQNLLSFLESGSGPVASTCRPGVREADLSHLLPGDVVRALRHGIRAFDRKMRGFVTTESTLVGVETRTSAPVRIRRDETGQSISHPGLYPAGEGAGYAGGIMSAALDGIRTAVRIIERMKAREA